eukprot:366222-Chlamydomonas_euryale.AAC.1
MRPRAVPSPGALRALGNVPIPAAIAAGAAGHAGAGASLQPMGVNPHRGLPYLASGLALGAVLLQPPLPPEAAAGSPAWPPRMRYVSGLQPPLPTALAAAASARSNGRRTVLALPCPLPPQPPQLPPEAGGAERRRGRHAASGPAHDAAARGGGGVCACGGDGCAAMRALLLEPHWVAAARCEPVLQVR